MSEWRNAALSELAEIRVSNVDKKSFPLEREVRLCNYMDVYGNDYITADLPFMEASATSAEIDGFGLVKGDVLLTKDSETPDDIGIPAVVVDQISNLVCGYHLALIRPDGNRVDPFFLAKQLAAWPAKKRFSRLANGSTRYGLSFSGIATTMLPVPALAEQRRIAEILATLDKAIERTEALIAKNQQIKAGLMHDLFTRGVTPDGHLRPPRSEAPNLYRKSPLGWFPADWKSKMLGGLAEIVSGVTLGPREDSSGGIEVPYLRVANVQDGYLDLSEIKTVRVSPEFAQKLYLKRGDVLMNEGGDFDKLGRGTVWNDEISPCIHQNHVFRVRPSRDDLRSEYLALWSQSEFGKKYFVLNSKQSTNLASINSSQLKRFLVALPSSAEQKGIEDRLKGANARIETLRSERGKLWLVKQGLMHDLLTGRVRVKSEESPAT